MLCKPVETLHLSHKSFCNHFWCHDYGSLETWLCGNYSSTLHNKRIERDTTYLKKIVILKLAIKLYGNSLIKCIF